MNLILLPFLFTGEYDPLLKWPFDYKVSLIMVDQDHRRHIVQTFKPSPSSSSNMYISTNEVRMNIASGFPKFADKSVLDDSGYIKDDVMYIKCIVHKDSFKSKQNVLIILFFILFYRTCGYC